MTDDEAATTPTLAPFEYAVIRAVPRADRGEYVGVVLYSQAASYLDCETYVDADRLRAIHPDVDVAAVELALTGIRAVCAGDPSGGRAAAGSLSSRFGWLTAPRSTVVRPGSVHSGVAADPRRRLERLVERLVR